MKRYPGAPRVSPCPLLNGVVILFLGAMTLSRSARGATGDWASGIRSEAAAGLAPRSYGAEQTSLPTATLELLSAAGFRLSGQNYTLLTRFQQRLFERQPNMLHYSRPILFNRLLIDYRQTVTHRLSLSLSGAAGVGSMDFMAASSVLASSTATTTPSTATPSSTASTSRPYSPSSSAQPSVLQLLTMNAAGRLDYQLSQREALDASVSSAKQQPLLADTSGLQSTHQYATSLGYSRQLSLRTGWRVMVTAAEIYGSATNYESASLQSTVSHGWSSRTASTGTAGFSVFRSGAGVLSWFPMAAATMGHSSGSESRRLTLMASTNLVGYYDPMLGRLRSTIGLGCGAIRQLGHRWAVNARVDISIPATARPIQANGSAASTAVSTSQLLPETFGAASVALSKLIGTQARLDTGVRATWLATHPSDFHLTGYQTWLFVAIALWHGTDQPTHGAWVL
jgi:hypothetical protein